MTPAEQTRCSRCDPDTYAAARVGGAGPLHSRPSRWLRARLLAGGAALGAALSLLSACAEEPSAPPLAEPYADLLQGPSIDPVIGRACTGAEAESCSLTLGEHDGMISCYEGTRSCQSGVLGPCENGYTFTLDRSSVDQSMLASERERGAGLRPLYVTTSSPTNCVNNPCNSYCREFIEIPRDPLIADPNPVASPLESWTTGSLADYPAEWVSLGVQEPCQVAGDCQFNTSCVDPALGSCGHSVCATGEPLITGCNRCADAVCATNADCCGTQPACAHDPCDTAFGSPLDANCDPCVTAICAAHPECCGTTWDASCVGYVDTLCAPLGQSCGCPDGSVAVGGHCLHAGDRRRDYLDAKDACLGFGTEWNLVQIDDAAENTATKDLLASASVNGAWLGGDAQNTDEWSWRAASQVFFINDAGGGSLQNGFTYENWEDGQPVLGTIGQGIVINASGEWHHETLDTQIDFICEGPPSSLNPRMPRFSWSSACVDLAVRACGVMCPGNVPLGLGACTPRLPTELDPLCDSFDLALGATCEEAGRPQVPVCNHGRREAPAGLALNYLPGTDLGSTAPIPATAGACTLSEPIPPGRCVMVSDCPGLTADSALVVNPAGAGQDGAECRFDDNWSVYQPFACGTPLCEAGSYNPTQVANTDCSISIQNPLGLETERADIELIPNIPQPHCAWDEKLWGASCYFFSQTVDYWNRAEADCQRRGGHLVALNSPAENTWVRNTSNPTRDLQIGLTDEALEGTHAWTNGSCRVWNNWDVGQPDDFFPPGGEQCARMTVGSIERWQDTQCDDALHLYVCETPVLDAQGACASDERMGPDGKCYFFDSKDVSAAEASDICRSRGTGGWNLVQITSLKVNDFVTGLLDCTPAWIGGVNPALTGMVVMLGDPYIDELGLWQGALGGPGRATLCQGPATPPAARQLSKVDDFSFCSGADQFYFEGSQAAPEAITLCPSLCADAATQPGGRIDVEIPCAPPAPPVQETIIDEMYYDADCDGGGVIWDFFHYDAVTPADSRIEFEIRTAPTRDELIANTIPFTPIAQAHAVPTDTQRCEINPPGCPIDIFTKLGAPEQTQKALELRVRLVPGSSGEGPLLRDWRVRYSCPPSQ